MKVQIDPDLQSMIQNSIGIIILGIVIVVALVILKVDGKEVALALGGAIGGFLGGRASSKPPTTIQVEPPKTTKEV
jgi:small-conductance mechanosensitive channel